MLFKVKKETRREYMTRIDTIIGAELSAVPTEDRMGAELDIIGWLAEYGGVA